MEMKSVDDIDCAVVENGNCRTKEGDEQTKDEITYKIDDVPPWYVCLILSFQHYLTMFGGTVAYPSLVAPHLCITEDDPARGYIVSTIFFVSGICTFLQSTFGVRLPIVQGNSMAFLVPIFAIMNLPEWQCPTIDANSTMTLEEKAEIWMPRMREVQGAIIGASVCEVAIGFFGVIGFLLNWITPLAIVPTISLVGLSLFAEAAHAASGNWAISLFTMLLMIIFSQCLRDVLIPYPKYYKKTGWAAGKFPLFKSFPVLLTIMMAWSLCAILTSAGVFSEDNPARTDGKLSVLETSPWFRVPYPGQWGVPTFSSGAMVGVLAGVIASAIESVGDYYACARLSGATPPPKHAINRGIWIEGIGCIIAGLFGTTSGTTSFSENIGAIGITKVASRRVIQYGSLLMLLFGMLGKFGAVFVTIPGPILGGIFCIMFSMITAVGLSTLHFVDLNSSRNLFVLGFSLFMGLCLPKWIQSNPQFIETGNEAADQALRILLSTNMLVGGVIGFLLDNIIPGTDKERGLIEWRKQGEGDDNTTTSSGKTYDVPYITACLEKYPIFSLLPVSPTYRDGGLRNRIIGLRKHFSKTQQSEERNTQL